MELIYKYSESSVKPVEVEKSKHTIFIRKDMVENERTDSDGNVTTYWSYQEAKLPVSDWDEYVKTSLMSGQKNGDDNQLIIMEAIADLYDAIASLQLGGTKE